jgi:hypothetical protein
MRATGIASLFAGLLVLGAGCIFSPKKDDGGVVVPPPPTYPALTSPDAVLLALQLSYQGRDSVEYKQLYDEGYEGTSQDLNDPPGSQITAFRKADEVAHLAALQRSPGISSVVLDFGPTVSWTRLSSDNLSHPEWAQIQIPSWHIEIFDNNNSTLYTATSASPITYSFAPTVAAPGDTLWKIIKWVEIGATPSGT